MSVATRFARTVAETARKTGVEMKRSGAAELVFPTLIVLDKRSLKQAEEEAGYKVALSFEAAQAAFDADAAGRTGEIGARLTFQRRALEAAEQILRGSLDRAAVDDGGFRESYLRLIGERAPELPIFAAAEQAAVEKSFDKLIFDVETLPRWGFMPPVRLAHHFRQGLASILFEGWGDDIDGLAAVMDPALDGTDYKLGLAPSRTPGGKPGVLIVAETPKLLPEQPFDSQRQQAVECLRIVQGMRNWYVRRRTAARYWADHADPALKSHADSRVRRDLSLG